MEIAAQQDPMTDKEIEEFEKQIDDVRVLQEAGYLSPETFEQHKYEASTGMMMWGGSFTRNLGITLAYADRSNALKIMRYWENLCQTYSFMYQAWIAKSRAIRETEEATGQESQENLP